MNSWEREADFLEGSVRELRSGAVAAMGEWLGELRPWSLFGTLTIDTRRQPKERLWCSTIVPRRVSRDKTVWMVREAMKRAGRALGARVDYVAGIEPHSSGDLHAHILAYTGQVGGGRNDIRALWSGWWSVGGFCKVEPPRDNMAVSEYASKYLVKPRSEIIFSPQLHLPRGPELRRMDLGW